MNEKTVICPNCFGELNTPTSLEGKEVQCPLCKKNFVVKFIPEEPSEKQQSKNTSLPPKTEKSGLKIVEKQSERFQGCKVGFIPISLVILILLLIIGNVLLLFSMQKHQENSEKLEREIRAISENFTENSRAIFEIIANPVYEYKVVTVKTSYNTKHEAIISDDSLHKILAKHPNWELVEAVSEIATEHPNFGKEEYVTGLQPDVRTQQIKLILRRKKAK